VSEHIEVEDVQGLVLSGYGKRKSARYVMFEIVGVDAAKRWLASAIGRLQFGEYRSRHRKTHRDLRPLCLNVAFTHAGLGRLGLHPTALAGFHPSFQEGLANPDRARRLGDDGESAPANWQWGREGEPLHGMLALFGDDDEKRVLDDAVDAEICEKHGLRALHVLHTCPTDQLQRREHFGFRDGISNPGIAGLSKRTDDVVAPGELLLGYPNGYGKLPLSPALPRDAAPDGSLPAAPDGRLDFGKNGSYLVFRQLEQHVHRFWEWMERHGGDVPEAPPGADGAVWLASRMVGRWPNGTPVSVYPDAPGPDDHGDDNSFRFAENHDTFGERCPIGAHVRRSNPRDTALPQPHDPLLTGDPRVPATATERLARVALHRIFRRGRAYGKPIDHHLDPDVVRAHGRDDVPRGLHFLCFNANPARQFEFVQSTWLNNPVFAGLSRDPDPLLSANREVPFRASDFTLQSFPPRQVKGLPRFVEVRGGAYFFMPGRRALEHLSR
jgi:Dyp-type peroxidase family